MTIKESFLRDIGRLFIWFPFRWACLILPISLILFLFHIMGNIHYFFGREKKKELKKNISLAFNRRLKEREIGRIVRRYFQIYYSHQFLIFLFTRLNGDIIKKMVFIEGLDHLNEALKQGKGCILLHGHFGLFQLPLFVLGLLGYQMNQITLPVDEGLSYIGKKVAFKYRMRCEAQIPAKLISAHTFLRPVFSALKKNEVVMITGDGAGGTNVLGKFVHLNFFNRTYPFPSGPISLSFKTGAPILPLFIVKKGVYFYKIIIGESIHLKGSAKNNDDLREGTRKFVKQLENFIRKYPCHWRFWDEFSTKASSLAAEPRGRPFQHS